MSVFTNLSVFIRERFPLKVTLPLSAILCAAPLSFTPCRAAHVAVGCVSVFLALLCLRIADDLSSLEADRLTHPDRGLPSGRINATSLGHALCVLVALLLAVNSSSLHRVVLLLATTAFYGLFNANRQRIGVLPRPLFSNIVFAGIPLYVCYLGRANPNLPHLLYGLFVWISAVAHEYAHNAHGPGEGVAGIKDYSAVLGARGTAIAATFGFAAAAVTGSLFWATCGQPPVFAVMLTATFIHIMYLGAKSIRHPVAANAQPFYICGFTFFLIPSIGLIVDCMLRMV